MGTQPAYACREDVLHALDTAETARVGVQVDRLLASASRSVDALCHRHFYPLVATRSFGWPDPQQGRPWRLWLDACELVELTSISSGGVSISPADVLLEPQRYGPPYSAVELRRDSNAVFGNGPTPQRDITISGVWAGCPVEETRIGALVVDATGSDTLVLVDDSSGVGVGHLIRVGTERMVVLGRGHLTTGQTLDTTLAAQRADTLIPLDDPAAVAVGEIVLVDAERMLVTDRTAAGLVVERAWGGSVLGAHSIGAIVYAPRSLFVQRGAVGTSATAHLTGDQVVRHDPPPLVRQLAIAETVVAVQREQSAYARTIGDGEGQRAAPGGDLRDLREQCRAAHGRIARIRVVA